MSDLSEFQRLYGPWALISGASDGTGAAFSRRLAERGLNLVLIARGREALAALAEELEAAHGIQTRIVVVDLYEPEASQRVIDAVNDLEVGLFVSNAGADTVGSRFLDAPIDAWRKLITRNVSNLVDAVHHFAAPMRARRRGGLIIMSSGTALGGMPGVAVYCATKAFDLNLAEALWTELKAEGVRVICGVCPAMNTPSLQRTLARAGAGSIPGIYQPDDVVCDLIANIEHGPTRIFPFGPDAADAPTIEKARKQRALTMVEAAKMFASKESG